MKDLDTGKVLGCFKKKSSEPGFRAFVFFTSYALGYDLFLAFSALLFSLALTVSNTIGVATNNDE